MRVGQAFAFAFGLVFVVLAFLYLAWRSAGRDQTASILRSLLTGLSVSMLVGTGTFFILVREPNVLIGVGMAIFAYASAVKTGFMGRHHLRGTPSLSSVKPMFRVYSSANLVAGCLSGIGCVIYGGPFGVLGAFVALYWVLLNLWFLKRSTADEASNEEPASTS